MRLYLAVAVLMLAFVAYTEAQEESIDQKFTKFGKQMSEIGTTVAEKAKSAFEGIQQSDTLTGVRSWFEEQIEKIQKQFS